MFRKRLLNRIAKVAKPCCFLEDRTQDEKPLVPDRELAAQ
jgi:hypothetical protein